MHEYSVANGIHRTVLSIAEAHALDSVAAVSLDIGTLSGISVEALEYSWNYIRLTSPLTTQAMLSINVIQAAGICSRCGFSGAVETALRICPSCGAPGLRFTTGEQLMLTEISGEPGATADAPVTQPV